jgi:toxin ParE1/3/4
MRVKILAEAEREIDEAGRHYDDLAAGLGERFRAEVWSVLRWIGDHHDVPPLRPKGYRRVNCRVFPYYIAYIEWSGVVWVLAVAHVRRCPEYWSQRPLR